MKKLFIFSISIFFISCNNNTIDYVKYSKKLDPSVFQIFNYDKFGKPLATGTGFFIENNGLALTNHHVVDSMDIIFIKDYSGNVFEVEKIVCSDSITDIALIKINCGKSCEFSKVDISSSDINKGEKVFVIGNPIGLHSTLSNGIVSSVRRHLNFEEIQVTAPISGGSSGSPIFNNKGNVIGIITSGFEDGQNLNLGSSKNAINDLVAKAELDSLNFNNKIFYKNLKNIRDYSLTLNSIELEQNQTNIYMSLTNLNLAWDTMLMWSSIGKDESWYIKDNLSGKKYNLLKSSLGSISNPSEIPFGATKKFVLSFPPLDLNISDSIDLINGETGADWSFRNLTLESIIPDLSNMQSKILNKKILRMQNDFSTPAFLNIALELMQDSQYVDSYDYLDVLIENTNNDEDLSFYNFLQGCLWYLSGDTLNALEMFNEAKKINISNSIFHFNAFYLNDLLQNYEDALTNISSCIAIRPDDLNYRRNRAEINYVLENWKSVVDDCTYCIENAITSLRPEDFLYRGLANEFLQDGYSNQSSCTDFKSAMNLTETDADFKYIYDNYYHDCIKQ